MKEYDVVIIGAGAAGMTAAMYTCRKQLKTVMISVDVGGQTNMTNHIENYPGVDAQPGPQLMDKFREQAQHFGAELIMGKVVSVEKADKKFKLTTADKQEFLARAVILGFGKVPRELGIPGENDFLGKGLSTCTTCDAPLFKNKITAVIGGGNSAVEAALELAGIAKKVFLVHRRDQFRADEITVKKLKAHANIELVLNHKPIAVVGEKFVTALKVEDVASGEQKDLAVDGVFKEIGYVADTASVKDLVEVTKQNEIVIDANCKTSCDGIFAAGDITTVPYKQTVISAGEGAKAALSCYQYLSGGKGVTIDWT